nr:hypothetical protein [Tanacetum cinerariifolium]
QELQARLVKLAGNAGAGDQLKQTPGPDGVTPAAVAPPGAAVAAPAPAAVQQPTAPAQAPKFTEADIPQKIGGQPFTPEQRRQLEAEGTLGLVRGLKDKQGNTFNGYVGVDREMNKVVVLPENKVTFKDEIAGVKLSPEQSHDLREGKA